MALPEDLALQVGNQWASRAKAMLFMDMKIVSTQNTMVRGGFLRDVVEDAVITRLTTASGYRPSFFYMSTT